MDPLSSASAIISYISMLDVLYAAHTFTRDFAFYTRIHGLAGALYITSFGSRSIWQLQAEVINSDDKEIAFSLKRLAQEESEIVAVARIKRPTKRNSQSLGTQTELVDAPSVASVITISAPFALLGLALHSFLVGFGIWLGFVWTKNLDKDAAQKDSRAVFITYAIGLGTCYVIYTLSNISAGPQQPLSTWMDDLGKKARRDTKAHSAFPTPRPISPSDEIPDALRKTARLRRALAESEERLADLYERLD
ncbi:hypothetical protein CHU98_g4767 [Xylaria longipes]|nr:hypothetical protein CHU98_g4767 [Xylaria longipes]